MNKSHWPWFSTGPRLRQNIGLYSFSGIDFCGGLENDISQRGLDNAIVVDLQLKDGQWSLDLMFFNFYGTL